MPSSGCYHSQAVILACFKFRNYILSPIETRIVRNTSINFSFEFYECHSVNYMFFQFPLADLLRKFILDYTSPIISSASCFKVSLLSGIVWNVITIQLFLLKFIRPYSLVFFPKGILITWFWIYIFILTLSFYFSRLFTETILQCVQNLFAFDLRWRPLSSIICIQVYNF